MLLGAQVTAPDFSIVLLPDTQNEAQYYPQQLDAQTQWVVDNQSSLNIQAVLGLGDIVNDGASDLQQQNADAAVRTLDNAGIPYFLAIGNHDYDGGNAGAALRDAAGFDKWFGPARYAGKPYYVGNYPAGSNENFYGVLTINGKQYLILVLEYYPRPSAVQWAQSILAANPDKEAIIVTHAYMYVDGTTVDTCDAQDMDPSSSTYGDQLWSQLVSQYPNIIMTVNGHFTNALGARRADLGVNGNLVNEMFSNYQDQPNGGNGWLRILTFHPASNTIDVKTYSPTLQQYKTDDVNQFTINYHNPGIVTGTGQISGRVRTATCQPVAGATVTAGSASATTDANGNYSLSVPAPASTTVSVSAAGEVPQTRTVTVNDNYSTETDFKLQSAGCAASGVDHTVTICTPGNNATVPSPVHVTAAATDSTGQIARMEIWLDGVKAYSTPGKTLDTSITAANGTHRLVVVAAESDTNYFKSTEYFTVAPPTEENGVSVQLTASPSTISAGQSATLSWTSSEATTVTISGVGTFGASGTTTVTPTATTSYTATATGAQGTATSSATVTVQSAATGGCVASGGNTVTICSPSDGSTVTSPMHVVAATTAAVARMEIWLDGTKAYSVPGNSLDTQLPASSGTHRIVVVAAYSDTNYFRAAENVTVSSAAPSGPSVQLSANPATITAGDTSTLSWNATNATSVTISGVGTFGPSGSATVSPTTTTTYSATATASDGTTASATATVTVASASSAGSGCTPSTTDRTVTICSPSTSTTSSPLHVVATSTDATAPVIRMEIWLDGVKVYSTAATSIDTYVPASSGTHRLVVVAAESDASYFNAVLYVTVQ